MFEQKIMDTAHFDSNSPFFSVVVPTYNRALHLSNAIESVLNQEYRNWELIIIDDGSTDNTKEIVESFVDERIRYVYQKNSERSAARNNGIQNAKGEWICFLDSDDYYLPDHLQGFYSELSQSDFNGVLLSGQYVKKKDQLIEHPLIDTNAPNLCKEIWTKFILMDSTCIHSACFKEHLFPEEFYAWEDTHLWLRLAATFPFEQLPNYTAVQEWHVDGSVYQNLRKVNLSSVERYFNAINDLEENYKNLLAKHLTSVDFKNYRDQKYKLFLYQSRQNKQFGVTFRIWTKAILNQPSLHLLLELPKALLNLLGIGIQRHF